MKKLVVFSLFLIQYEATASIKATFDEFLYETKMRARYYQPYAVGGSLVGLGLLTNRIMSTALLSAAGVYSLYAWYTGFFDIRTIRYKYKREIRPKDHWSGKKEDEKPFLFCRWRQQDDSYGDGIYWSTAWWMHEHRDEVVKQLIKDIYSNRIKIGSSELPKPDEVLKAINRELKELEADKETLKRYTNVYRTMESAEEWHPDKSKWRIFWPNYNHASRLYIDLVIMLKRLEVLRDIISSMKLSSGGHGWPQQR